MIDNLAVLGAVGLLGLSTVPGVSAALSWDVCAKNAQGVIECHRRIPRSARVATAVVMLLVLILLCVLVVFIIRNRRAAAAEEKEYNVEASQMDGPPTIIATEYNPRLGPSPVYSASGQPNTTHVIGNLSPQPPTPQMSGPSFPATVHHYNNNTDSQKNYHQTAPPYQASFPDQPYPFTPQMGPTVPKSAFVSGGFPRPLLAGNRLKDKLRERPASISSESTLVGPEGR